MQYNIRCPICEKTRSKLWGKKNGYVLYHCLSCTHKFADLGSIGRPLNDPDLFRKEITNNLMPSDDQ